MGDLLKILELFCGTKSISKEFIKAGHNCLTVDSDLIHKPDICCNILDFDISMIPKEFKDLDVIWASPPCTTFSVASIRIYWKNGKPKSYKTYIGLAIVKKTIEIIQALKPRYWFIENPPGMLRKQYIMRKFPRKTLTYCQYGATVRKSTDIWTNAIHWILKKKCHNGDNCHQEAKKGSKLGIQGIGGRGVTNTLCEEGLTRAQSRAIIPSGLCSEIVKVCENKTNLIQKSLDLI